MATPELAAAGAPASLHSFAHRRAALVAFAVREALPIAAAALHVALIAALLPYTVVQDTWLALVAGREVASGLPHRETLTVLAAGVEWVDQQWLGQLALYGLHRLGGLGAALAVHALVLTVALVVAVVAARRLGGSPRAVGGVAAGSVLLAPWAWQLRTQSLVYGLFVAVLWLLAADARHPSRRMLLVLPLLAVWANVHGSVLVGALLVVVAAVLGRRWALAAAAPLCVLVSPYAADLPGYYRTMLLDADLGRFVVEWGWTAPSLVTAPFWALAGLTAWALVRRAGRAPRFDRIALALTLAAGIAAMRSVVWFALAAVVLLPGLLSSHRRAADTGGRGRLAVAIALVGTAVGVTAFSLPSAGMRAEAFWPAAASDAVAAAAHADPRARVFASERYADWLLWRLPELRGRVAFDARFELQAPGTLARVSALYHRRGHDWRSITRGYDVLVLEPSRADLVAALAAEPGTRTLFESEEVAILERRTP